MIASEEAEMLELCEPELDDLKAPEDISSPEIPTKDEIKETKQPEKQLPDPIKDKEVGSLYQSLGIDLKDPKIVTHTRLDTIHVNGLDEMNTQDLYKFFEPLKPIALEWIDDSSCNVVWLDDPSAAKALLEFSHPMEEKTPTEPASGELEKKDAQEDKSVKDSNEIVMIDEDDEEDGGSEDGELPEDKEEEKKEVVWRISENPNVKPLKMRFATWDDKKVRGAEKFSEYYKKHGNPNFGGLKGLISNSRKRRFRDNIPIEDFSSEDPPSPDHQNLEDARHRISHLVSEKSERKDVLPKTPKMKMYADEEEKTMQRQKSSKISNRLGSITVNFSMDEEDEEEEDYDELEISSPQEFGSKSVWDRLQVEVPNTRFSYGEDKKRARTSDHKADDYPSRRDLRKKLQRIRDHKKKDHRSPLLVDSSSAK